jgi:hypothetical protein
MNVRDLFGLTVRLTGFALVVMSLFDFLYLVSDFLGLPLQSTNPPARIAMAGAFYALLGVGIIAAAESITRLVYGRRNGDKAP